MKYATLTRFALSLPEAAEQPHHHFASFRVRGRIFVTVPPGETHIHVFVGDEVRDPVLAMYPDFVEPLRWGSKVVGLRIALESAKVGAVKDLVRKSYIGKAPAALAADL